MTLVIFSTLLLCLSVYGFQFAQVPQEPAPQNEEMRGKVAWLVVFITLVCVSRCLYAILTPWFPEVCAALMAIAQLQFVHPVEDLVHYLLKKGHGGVAGPGHCMRPPSPPPPPTAPCFEG